MVPVSGVFYIDSSSPLAKYDVVFQPDLPPVGQGSSQGGIGASYALPDGSYVGVPEQLEDEIHWEPHVDRADRLDYIVAVSSGVISGLIDVFYVGEFSLDRASEWGKDHIEKIVMRVARVEGYEGNDLKEAIRVLEKKCPFVSDGNMHDFGSGLHHFRDFSHHFSIGGLFFSILTQFTELVVGADESGRILIVPIRESYRKYIGKNFEEKIAFGAIGWFFHMVSDMAGSSASLDGGTGIPGPLLSFMKEMSVLPFFKDAQNGELGFRKWLSKLFNGTWLADHDETGKIINGTRRRFDLRTEIGILHELGRQTMPVLINQCIVRGFYFCRRLFREIRDLDIHRVSDLDRIAPEDVLPWGTPAMRRMILVSSGVFSMIDTVDAGVSAFKARNPKVFFLRINFVGVATFVVSCAVDVRVTIAERRMEEGETPEETYERKLADLGCLKLDFQKARIMHSLIRHMIAYDASHEKRAKRAEKKKAWLDEWSKRLVETLSIAWAADAGYFMDESMMYGEIDKLKAADSDDSWLWLVALEAMLFKAYAPLHGGNDGQYKGLKLSTDYLSRNLCVRHGYMNEKELRSFGKSFERARGSIDGAFGRHVAAVAGVAVVAVASGGLAFYFAPALAPTLAVAFGAEVTALSGAALTSASLAFLGGGALAAGGAGMAGGVMLIAGGGALIGAAGGTGISTAMSMALATNASFVLSECSKLVTFSEEILIKRYGDLASVASIHYALNQRIVEFEIQAEAVRRGVPEGDFNSDDSVGDEVSPKKMLKTLEQSLKYLRRSSDRLEKAMAAATKNAI